MVPTLDEAKSGVYRKCGRGETMTISLFCEATLRKADNAPQPDPRITIFSGSEVDDDDHDDDDLSK
jgi:hypothetical protein